MTTSILNPESSALVSQEVPAPIPAASAGYVIYRIRHTLASRFAFLMVCLAIILSALAYGTVHYWALAIFFLAAITILVLWLIDSWNLGTFRVSRNILQLPVLGMFLLGVFQLLPLRHPEDIGTHSIPLVSSLSFDPYSTRLVLVQTMALLIYFAAVLVFTDTPKRLRLLVRTIGVFGFFLAIFGLTQSFTSPDKIYWMRELPQSQAFGPFINRHHFAGYMELALALPLGLVLTGAIEKEKRFIYVFAAGLMAVALVMTNSRGGIISLLAEVLFLVATMGLRRRRRRKHRKTESESESDERPTRIRSAAVKAGLALALIVALFGSVVLLGGEDALTRVVGSVNTDDPTTGRAHFWSVTVDIIKTHPWIGTGLGAFGVVYTGYDSRNGMYRLEQAHNDYLQTLSDGGIIGALLGLFFIVNLFRMGFIRRASRDDFRRGVATGAMAGCFAVLVHSFFDFTLHTPANALLFLTMAALATMNGRVEDVQSRRIKRPRRSSTTTTDSSPQPALLTTQGESPG
ncbi:MAG TPA: O-antigen ligase family protein [Pyrinomonadaceae bacterium]|jgi:O-antigen ligase|nr:O-antigen ligase family protein [Pyrinomonadaceae bacterium]